MAAQILATIIFLIMFGFIITEKAPRHLVTLVCAAATLLLVFGVCMHSISAVWETLNLESFFHTSFWYSAEASESGGINWETIVFLAGMMIMVEGMADSGFFQWLCITIAKAVHYRPFPIFLTFMLLSAALSMFIDSITVILFLSTVTIELGQLLKFDPVPAILAEVFCANLGGSATMCGDPPNIIIGTSLGYSFGDFISNTGLIAGICLLLVIPYFCLCFHKEFRSAPVQELNLDPKDAINDPKEFFGSCAIFLAAVLLLSTHAQTGLTVSAIGVLIAAVTLLAFRKRAVAILRQIDHNTLIFFIGLFVVISGLQRSGVLDLLAQGIGKVSGSNVHPDDRHYPLRLRRGQRLHRQHPLRGHHDPRDPEPFRHAGGASRHPGLDPLHRHGRGRQRHAHRRLRQRGGPVPVRQERHHHRLGPLLQGDGSRHAAGHRGVPRHPLPALSLSKILSHGGASLTDVPNFVLKFGWRKPHPRRTPPLRVLRCRTAGRWGHSPWPSIPGTFMLCRPFRFQDIEGGPPCRSRAAFVLPLSEALHTRRAALPQSGQRERGTPGVPRSFFYCQREQRRSV